MSLILKAISQRRTDAKLLARYCLWSLLHPCVQYLISLFVPVYLCVFFLPHTIRLFYLNPDHVSRLALSRQQWPRSVCRCHTCVANGSARARLSVSECVCHGQSQAGQHKWGPFISPGWHMARRRPQTLRHHRCNLLARRVILHTGGEEDWSVSTWQWAWSDPFTPRTSII